MKIVTQYPFIIHQIRGATALVLGEPNSYWNHLPFSNIFKQVSQLIEYAH